MIKLVGKKKKIFEYNFFHYRYAIPKISIELCITISQK